MSTADIIKELPRLTEAERRAVRDKLLELATEQNELALCDAAAIEGARLLDRMEVEDAGRSQK